MLARIADDVLPLACAAARAPPSRERHDWPSFSVAAMVRGRAGYEMCSCDAYGLHFTRRIVVLARSPVSRPPHAVHQLRSIWRLCMHTSAIRCIPSFVVACGIAALLALVSGLPRVQEFIRP
jgi:hypothetical protein